jgi:hypothetical protein
MDIGLLSKLTKTFSVEIISQQSSSYEYDRVVKIVSSNPSFSLYVKSVTEFPNYLVFLWNMGIYLYDTGRI